MNTADPTGDLDVLLLLAETRPGRFNGQKTLHAVVDQDRHDHHKGHETLCGIKQKGGGSFSTGPSGPRVLTRIQCAKCTKRYRELFASDKAGEQNKILIERWHRANRRVAPFAALMEKLK